MKNKIKPALAAFTASLLLLSGCSAEGAMIQPVANCAMLPDLMPEETYEIMSGVYGEYFIDLVGMLEYVGNDVSGISFADADGNELSLGDLAGKDVIVEVVASWCGYCQAEAADYISDVYDAYDDVVFVTLFADGAGEEIESFYESAGVGDDSDYTIPSSVSEDGETQAGVAEFVETAGIDSYPTFVFVDSSGKISWIYSGLVDAESMEALAGAAFGETKIYETFTEETVDFDALARTAEDVSEDLSDEAHELIDSVDEDEGDQEVLYANLGREFIYATFATADGGTLEMASLSGSKFVFEILAADEYFYEGSLTSACNLSKYKEDGVIYVQFWIPGDGAETEEELIEYLEEAGAYGSADYVILLTDENNVSELMDIDVYSFPTQFFVDEGYRIAGAAQGAMTSYKYEDAVAAFWGGTPLYMMAADEEE